MDNIKEFEKELSLIPAEEVLSGEFFVSDDWTLGYIGECEKCGNLKAVVTDIYIPFDDAYDNELESLICYYGGITIHPKFSWVEDSVECMCDWDEEEYEDEEQDE